MATSEEMSKLRVQIAREVRMAMLDYSEWANKEFKERMEFREQRSREAADEILELIEPGWFIRQGAGACPD